MISGLWRPSCIAALFAIETRMKDGSVDIELVGNGHTDSKRIA
jgi:hypothetical protein